MGGQIRANLEVKMLKYHTSVEYIPNLGPKMCIEMDVNPFNESPSKKVKIHKYRILLYFDYECPNLAISSFNTCTK